MKASSKNLLIFLGSYLLVIIIFIVVIQRKDIIFSQYQGILLFLFFLLGGLVGILWNSQDKNTKKLKHILIIGEVYLLGLLAIQPFFNISQGEFLILLLCGVGIWYLSLSKYQLKNIGMIFLFSIIIFIINISIFMVYRSPLVSSSPFQNHASLHIFSAEYLSPIEGSISLKSTLSTQNFPLDGKYREIILYEDGNYLLSFSLSYYSEENNQVFIISPLGTIYQIFPQSNIKINVDGENIVLEAIEGKFIKYTSDTPSDNILIKGFQQQVKYFEKKEKLEKIPNYITQNPNITRMSRDFTFFLSRFFPLIYGKNLDYYKTYEPFLELEEKSIFKTTPFLKEKINNNREIGIQQTNIKNYLKKLFTIF